MRCRGNASGTTCNVKVYFEAADNPTVPSNYSDLISRPLSTGIAWNNVDAWIVGNWYDTPDLSSDLQVIVNRTGWENNNYIIVHILDNGSTGNAYRNPGTYNYGYSYQAKLVVSYSA